MNEAMQIKNEDEIDLKELWKVLLKCKKMLILLTGSITFVACVYALFITKPLYEAKAVLEIGLYSNSNSNSNSNTNTNTNMNVNVNWIENPSTVLKKIEINYIENRNTEEKVWLNKISFVKGTQNLLELSVLGFSKELATAYLKEIEASISIRHQKLIDAYIDSVKMKIENLNTQKAELLIEKERLGEELNRKSNYIEKFVKENPAVAAVYSIELNNYTVELKNLKNSIYTINNQLNDLKLDISSKNLKMTEFIDNITASDRPVKPKKALIIVVGFVTGLILSVFLAFFLELIGKNKHE